MTAVLSWTCLLPGDASYTSVGAPPAIQEALRVMTGGGPRALVAWHQHAGALRSLDGFAAVVAIDCGGVTERRLCEAGFGYVRRFAVVPSLANPRWFVPLDARAISAAAFSLFMPVRRRAWVQHGLARCLARAGLDCWYRNQIIIAQRELPPLERLLQKHLGPDAYRLAISSGMAAVARNGKTSFGVLTRGGQIVGFGKLSGSDITRRLVQHEATMLSAMANLADRGQVPRLLVADCVDGRYVTVASPLPGRAPGKRVTEAHQRFLRRLQSASHKPAASTEVVGAIRHRIHTLTKPRADLAAMLEEVMPVLSRLIVPITIVHRDFTPWNLRCQRGVVSAFDWEYGQLDGVPLLDECHHTLAVGFLLGRWSAEQAAERLRRMAASAPLGLPPRQAMALQVVYLLDYVSRLIEEGYEAGYPKLVWWRDVLDRVMATWRSCQAEANGASANANVFQMTQEQS